MVEPIVLWVKVGRGGFRPSSEVGRFRGFVVWLWVPVVYEILNCEREFHLPHPVSLDLLAKCGVTYEVCRFR
jgi:hypothetical protein